MTMFTPGPVLRAKHPATKQKAYFGTLLVNGLPHPKKLDTPFKRVRDAKAFAETLAEAMNKKDDQRPEVAA